MRKSTTAQKVPFLAPDTITKVIPSPTDGWDAISPLAEMDPKRAVQLINFVPRPGWVELRGGYQPFANTGSGTPINSLMVYRPSSGSQKMFAASGSKIYDTSIAFQNATVVVTGLTSDKFQYINYVNGAGTALIQAANGIDNLLQFDGTSWTNPSITGLANGTTANIIGIHGQKQRLWYIMNNSTVVNFMPVGANTGPAGGSLDLGPYWSQGGFLEAMANWTIDGGVGPQDYVAFISSRGQIALYTGTDPTNPATFQLVGVFTSSPPVGRRCTLKVGSDVAIITQQGVIPISQTLPFDPSADRSVAVTSRIQNAMALALAQFQNNFGWELITYPNQQLLILNVPTVVGQTSEQYVMNTLTGAWCRFTGWNANTFAILNDSLYFGDMGGVVQQAYSASADGVNAINAKMQCAFNWLDDPGRTKRMTMIQPLMVLNGILNPTISIDTDFNTSTAVGPVTGFLGTTLWDVALWDVALWPQDASTYNPWLSTEAIGHSMAVDMVVSVSSQSNTAGVFDVGQFDVATFDSDPANLNPIFQINAFNCIVEMGAAI